MLQSRIGLAFVDPRLETVLLKSGAPIGYSLKEALKTRASALVPPFSRKIPRYRIKPFRSGCAVYYAPLYGVTREVRLTRRCNVSSLRDIVAETALAFLRRRRLRSADFSNPQLLSPPGETRAKIETPRA